ncbi:IS66 family transposase [Sphaerimonospora cavernae]|uniref:IS66 family transposase n=1 Tax=Sphaerimonospora cavernae TaxID=1740611 RepID=A0ABV6U8W4_9ACTN
MVEAKDAEIAALKALLAEERAARAAEREAEGEAHRRLELRLAELERRLGMNSSNSSTPPSKESIAAKAKRKAERQRSQRERSKDRKPGGQRGHRGSGLEPARGDEIDDTKTAEPPAECSGCGADLGEHGVAAGRAWGQVWDIPPITLEKVHWLLPRIRCSCCAKVTTAAPPSGRVGTVVYGPNVNAAAIMLSFFGNVPVERTALVMEALLGAAVSPGFVARAHERFDGRLADAGFDEAMTAALRAEDVLCGDESPVNVLRKDLDETTGEPKPGQPHAVVIRTPDERLVWLTAIGARTKEELKNLGVLDGWDGIFVRDDYKGWHQFDASLGGVQQCVQHLLRHLQGVADLHPAWQQWATQVQQILKQAHAAVTEALADGKDHLDPVLLAELRARYDEAVRWGEITNRHRDWHEGNHPGYVLARRLKDKADQVWTFTRNLAVSWTNNASEQALKGPKRHQAVSGYWHTMATLGRYCRVRSYLVTAKGHGIRAIDAIHAALAGRPWLPTPIAA